jgi:flavin reductase (DIM6/NTAB) family NADH-FMN oxidoreductase RutF
MEFDFTNLPAKDRYRLLCSFVAPRPIALVTTIGPDGGSNAAPMSFFNVFSQEPPIVILGIQARPDGSLKDTAINIQETGEFVVNLVDMAIAKQMITCGINFPRGVDEVEKSGLSLAPSLQVRPGRIREAPCSMECRVHQSIDFPRRVIVLGEVVQMNVRDDCLDDDGHYVRPEVYQPIARLHADNYIVADRQFVLKPDETI